MAAAISAAFFFLRRIKVNARAANKIPTAAIVIVSLSSPAKGEPVSSSVGSVGFIFAVAAISSTGGGGVMSAGGGGGGGGKDADASAGG